MNYKILNNAGGWLMFAFSMLVYTLTVEPTASYWDCGEFIAVSYKLMVPHPPGAPLFLLIGRLFSFMALGDVTEVAFWVNMVSVVSSALTILFLFWTITMLAKRLVVAKGEEPNLGQMIGIFGSGIIGAAAFTFSDSFWFSAVEAEVYAMSSAFTAVVFWAILKWDAKADDKDSDRWLLVIAYLVGLSIGVHLLNLVAIPAIAAVYYYRKYKPTGLGLFLTIVIGGMITAFITFFIIPGIPSLAGKFEVTFVNSFGLPFNSGILFFSFIFIGGLAYGIFYSIQKKMRILNLALTAVAFILIGYSSYGIIVVRSGQNPTIDENNPEEVLSFVSYLKREQYGDRPLLYGPMFTAQLISQENGDPIYVRQDGKYEIVDYKIENEWQKDHQMLFPRMYSTRSDHMQLYQKWVDMRGLTRDQSGAWSRKPKFGENLEFFFNYQIGWMFKRYFMWNFAGREGDWQDADWLAFGGGENLPHSVEFSKARNTFFLLPFLLGVLGLFFQAWKKSNDAIIVFLLFFFTGIAVIIYLNQPPVEPRERDYTYAGAFYAFAIWIGLGVLMVGDLLGKLIKSDAPKYAIATVLSLAIPAVMGAQGWDDHDRHNRWHSVDSAKNLLNSCAKNAILFTGGDNDTFPLWYVQEVEGFRTDVRVCNLSLLGTDWYITAMKRDAYESKALPISMEYAENYITGTNDYVPYAANPAFEQVYPDGIDLKMMMRLIREEKPDVMRSTNRGEQMATFPVKKFRLPVPKDKDFSYVPEDMQSRIEPEAVSWDYGKSALYKNHLLMLDILAQNNWERPIYYSTTLSQSDYMGLRPYMQLEGLAYRLTPAKSKDGTNPFVADDIAFKRLTEDMFWREMDNPDVFYDENYRRFPLNARNSFYKVVVKKIQDGEKEEAKKLLDYCLEVMPDKAIPYDIYTIQFASAYFQLGEKDKAMEILNTMSERSIKEMEYWIDQKGTGRPVGDFLQRSLYTLYQATQILRQNGEAEKAAEYEQILQQYNNRVQARQRRG